MKLFEQTEVDEISILWVYWKTPNDATMDYSNGVYSFEINILLLCQVFRLTEIQEFLNVFFMRSRQPIAKHARFIAKIEDE